METKSEQARRAALSRRVHRGGRPRLDDAGERSIKLFGRDYTVLKAYSALRGSSLKQAVNILCHALIYGGTIPPRPQLAPEGWRLIR